MPITTPAGRRVVDEARHILSTVAAGTHPSRAAWAAGVISAGHALRLVRYAQTRDPRDLCPSEMYGGSLEHGRWYDGNRTGVTIRQDSTRMLTVTWTEVARLLDPTLRHRGMLNACRATVTSRWACEPHTDAWSEADQACADTALAVWARLEPADAEQLDLLDIMGVQQ